MRGGQTLALGLNKTKTFYTVAVTRITYMEVEATSPRKAVDLVLQGEGTEIDQTTLNAEALQKGDLRPAPPPQSPPPAAERLNRG